MKIGGSQSFDVSEWGTREMNLDSLVDFTTGNWVSMLGQSTVYVWWRFRSDGNPNPTAVGSFVDNIELKWDDGLMNLGVSPPVNSVEVFHARDTTAIAPGGTAARHDTLMARFGWQSCDGGVNVYPPFEVMLTLWCPERTVVLFDTVVTADTSGTAVSMFSPPWIQADSLGYGEFVVRLTVDTLNAIQESNENDNADTTAYNVLPPNLPPDFHWITPGSDTLWGDRADTTVTLRWFLSDPEEPCSLTIRNGNSPAICTGVTVLYGHQSIEAQDSLVWDIRGLLNNRTYWLWAEVWDSENDSCYRATWPLRTCTSPNCPGTDANPPTNSVPEAYFLEQNYPNPFNPVTDIHYGIAVPGHVTLRVFDLLGREQATLVNSAQSPGSYNVPFDGNKLPSGLYVYVLTSPEGTIARKMMLLK
jgi:hypothetical protein